MAYQFPSPYLFFTLCPYVLFILLGAVPFPTDVPCLKALGVSGVVTLNEPYETLVPTSLYHNIPPMERQYMFTERLVGGAVQQLFSLTLLNTGTTPGAAYGYVRSIRPRVLLASSQWRVCMILTLHFFVCLFLRALFLLNNKCGNFPVMN
ncbi:hypothetical protein MANES_05G053202v8 [Manihot esculenta]|uniref:Uncharacterized protein n=1 Tax=Manihot esculenta TaxID=3983 RepID=A0ACB7HPV9_MANES|nr:hypothetical protein MANES_05G053202v8 [Manihot esculenta]